MKGRNAANVLAQRARSVAAAVPDAALAAARRVLVDTVGCMLAGTSDPAVRGLASTWAGGGGGRAPVAGTGASVDAPTAALVGGTAAVWHDYDCGDRFLGGHPAAHIVPAALALSGDVSFSGNELLAALVAGFEVAAAVRRSYELHPLVHPHGTWPAIGAAAATALLLGLDDDGMAAAIEIAGSSCLATTFRSATAGATVRNLYAGLGASAGLVAAHAARAGLTGLRQGMDDVYGTVVANDRAGPALPASDTEVPRCVGRDVLEIERSYFKAHACARYLHSALDALEEAVAGSDGLIRGIDKVVVHTYRFAASMADPMPGNELAARFSLPYALAVALVTRGTGIDAFRPPTLSDPRVRAMAARIEVVEDPHYSAQTPAERPARVELHSAAETIVAEVRLPDGEPDHRPMSDEALHAKFRCLAGRVLGPRQADDALMLLAAIDEVPEMGRAVDAFAPRIGTW